MVWAGCVQATVADDDSEAESAGANYQLEMMRCLREVNVDNNTVGWWVQSMRELAGERRGKESGAKAEEGELTWGSALGKRPKAGRYRSTHASRRDISGQGHVRTT